MQLKDDFLPWRMNYNDRSGAEQNKAERRNKLGVMAKTKPCVCDGSTKDKKENQITRWNSRKTRKTSETGWMTGQFCGSEVEESWGGFSMLPRLRANSSCHVIYIHFLLAWLKNTNSCFIPTYEMCQKSHFRFPSLPLLILNVFTLIRQFFTRSFRVTQVFIQSFLRSENESWRSEIQTAIRHSQTFALFSFTFFLHKPTGNRKNHFSC